MAGTYHGDFQFFHKLKDSVAKIELKDLKGFIDSKLKGLDELSRLTLLYQGEGSDKVKNLDGFQTINDPQQFRDQFPKIQPYKDSVQQ